MNSCANVQLFSVDLTRLEGAAMKHEYRYLYTEKPSRVPAWLRRIWLWF